MRVATICLGAAVLALGGPAPSAAQDSFGEASRTGAPQSQAPAPGPTTRGPLQAPRRAEPDLGAQRPSVSEADRLSALERQDYDVTPSPALHAGEMHGPTPTSIPGGQVVTTEGLVELMRGGRAPFLLLDVLGGPEIIQGAQYAVPAAQPGTFRDQTQQQFGQFLSQATGGNKDYPVVLYCLSTQCWMSYNAALRAINLGYTNVLWYRGGIDAWKQAGLPCRERDSSLERRRRRHLGESTCSDIAASLMRSSRRQVGWHTLL